MLKLSDTLPERLTAIVAQLDGKATCSQSNDGILELKFNKCWFLTSSVSSQNLGLSRAGIPDLGSPWSVLLNQIAPLGRMAEAGKVAANHKTTPVPASSLPQSILGWRESWSQQLHDLIVKAQKRTQLK